MSGYDAVIRIAKKKPEYLPMIEKCIVAHRELEKRPHFMGFEWHQAQVHHSVLMSLATTYGFLEISYKSTKHAFYKVKDIEGAEAALQSIKCDGEKSEKALQPPKMTDGLTTQEEMKPEFCWHIRDYDRLRSNLSNGYCDLRARPKADRFYKRGRLRRGIRVQFCITRIEKDGVLHRGLIVAYGTIAGYPRPLPVPGHLAFPMCIDISNIEFFGDPFRNAKYCLYCQKYPRRGSHLDC